MKSRIFQVVEQSTGLKVSFFGCNMIDIYYNSFEGFKRLVFKRAINRPEPKVPTYPVVHSTIKINGKDMESVFAEWSKELLKQIQVNRYMPLSIDFVSFDGTELVAQVSYRMTTKKDKPNFPIKGMSNRAPKLEKTKSGYQVTVKIDLQPQQ